VTENGDELIVARPVARAIPETLPEPVAAACERGVAGELIDRTHGVAVSFAGHEGVERSGVVPGGERVPDEPSVADADAEVARCVHIAFTMPAEIATKRVSWLARASARVATMRLMSEWVPSAPAGAW